MTTFAAHEAANGAQVQQWHDEAWAEYEPVLEAWLANPSDPEVKAAYVEKRDQLVAGVQYWRQVGEQCGTRTGIAVENHTITPEEN